MILSLVPSMWRHCGTNIAHICRDKNKLFWTCCCRSCLESVDKQKDLHCCFADLLESFTDRPISGIDHVSTCLKLRDEPFQTNTCQLGLKRNLYTQYESFKQVKCRLAMTHVCSSMCSIEAWIYFFCLLAVVWWLQGCMYSIPRPALQCVGFFIDDFWLVDSFWWEHVLKRLFFV